MAKYKNKTKETLSIPGIGVVKPGEIIEAENFNNANFEKVEEKKVENLKEK